MLSRNPITRSGRGFRVRFPSSKMKRTVDCESPLEGDAALLLECSPGVIFYQEQPTKIEYFDGRCFRSYHPDFEVILTDGCAIHLEVKPSSELAKPHIRAKFSAIAAHYQQRRQHFRIVTEQDIRREPLLSNARTLAYLSSKQWLLLPTRQNVLQDLGADPLSFEIAESKLGRLMVLRLLACGILECDLTQPLSGSTLVTIAKGGRHATYLL